MKSVNQLIRLTLLAGMAAALASCNNEPEVTETQPKETPASESNPAIEASFLDAAPGDAISVVEAREQAEPGKTITIKGRVAGAAEPFSADFATMVLVDDSVMTCEKIPGDSCETPWDACCVPNKKLAASRLLVQIVDEDGRPLGQGLKGVHGLTELDDLVIQGTVAEGSDAENLIVNASGIFRQKS